MPINAQYAWEVCAEAAEKGKMIRLVCDDGYTYEGIPMHVHYDYVIVNGLGFAHAQTDYIQILED